MPEEIQPENEVEAAHREANKENDPADSVEQFPKMLYLHPKDKAKEHKYITVKNEDEAKQAGEKGYQDKPYVPEPPQTQDYEGDGTKTPTDDLSNHATKQRAPGEVIEDQHVEQKPTEHEERVEKNI